MNNATKNKSSFVDWLSSNMLRPVVIGDENFAFRLRAYIGSHDSFSCFDAESLMSANYEPNLIVIIGPMNEALNDKMDQYQRSNKMNVLYVESVMNDSERDLAVLTAKKIGARASVIKEFIEVTDVAKALKELASV